MKKILTIIISLCTMLCSAQTYCRVASTRQITNSDGYFPQINYQGTQVLYSDTEARYLYLYDLQSGERTTVSSQGMPGFEGRFAPDGKVYYITMAVNPDHLIFRTGHEYDPATGHDRVILSAQHGAVHAINGSKDLAVVGESKQWHLREAGVVAWTLGPKLYVSRGGTINVYTPVRNCAGYLWASVSPDGKKVLFEAVGKGLYVCDAATGEVMAHSTTSFMMPCRFNNDYIVGQTKSYRIVLIPADCSGQQTLASGSCTMPMVAGKNIIYTTKGGAVRLISIILKGEEGYDESQATTPPQSSTRNNNSDDESQDHDQ